MAIQFRCNYCKSLLGIADSQAGVAVDCPRCGRTQRVPGRSPRPAEGNPVPDLRLQQALSALSDLNTTPATSPAQTSDSAETDPAATPVVLIDGLRENRVESGQRSRLLLACLLLVVFLSGFLTGRLMPFSADPAQQSQPASTGIRKAANAELPQPMAGAAEQAAAKQPRQGLQIISGRVSFRRDGQEHPDAGALMFLLPLKNPTQLRFQGGTLHPGPTDPAWLATAAAMQELQADLCVADSSGDFQLKYDAGIDAAILVISRHCSRAAENDMDQHCRDLAEQWFDSVTGLAGRLSVQMLRIPRDSEPLNIVFQQSPQ
jgi:hypothetical protein